MSKERTVQTCTITNLYKPLRWPTHTNTKRQKLSEPNENSGNNKLNVTVMILCEMKIQFYLIIACYFILFHVRLFVLSAFKGGGIFLRSYTSDGFMLIREP